MRKPFFVINYTGGFDIVEAENHTEIALSAEGAINIVPLEKIEEMIQSYRSLCYPLPEGMSLDEYLFFESQDNANGEQ